jgi:hypothetical protein
MKTGRDDQCEQRPDRAGHAVRLLVFPARQERRIHGNERRRHRALAEHVLEEIGNAEAGAPGVGGVAFETEVMGEHALTNQSDQT